MPAVAAVVAAVHGAVVVASWMFATLVYAIAVARSRQLGWAALDAAVIAGCVWLVHARRDALGFRSLGARRGAKLAAIVVLGTACALIVQLAIRDRNGCGSTRPTTSRPCAPGTSSGTVCCRSTCGG